MVHVSLMPVIFAPRERRSGFQGKIEDERIIILSNILLIVVDIRADRGHMIHWSCSPPAAEYTHWQYYVSFVSLLFLTIGTGCIFHVTTSIRLPCWVNWLFYSSWNKFCRLPGTDLVTSYHLAILPTI